LATPSITSFTGSFSRITSFLLLLSTVKTIAIIREVYARAVMIKRYVIGTSNTLRIGQMMPQKNNTQKNKRTSAYIKKAKKP